MVASGVVTLSTILAKRRCHVSPTPTGCTPGYLSSAIRRPDIDARYAAQGRLPLARKSTKLSTLVLSLVLYLPNFRSNTCSASESVPPGPELPRKFCATDYTASSVMSTGMKIGVSSYVSNIAQEGIVLLG